MSYMNDNNSMSRHQRRRQRLPYIHMPSIQCHPSSRLTPTTKYRPIVSSRNHSRRLSGLFLCPVIPLSTVQPVPRVPPVSHNAPQYNRFRAPLFSITARPLSLSSFSYNNHLNHNRNFQLSECLLIYILAINAKMCGQPDIDVG